MKLKNFDDFINENEELNEDTIEGYRYHFDFDGKEYIIDQGKDDETIFGIKKKEGNGWLVMTKGNLFDPATNSMDRNEMVKFIQNGIKYFNVRNPVDAKDVRESEWKKFFAYELEHKPGRINKKYVILKLHAGKSAAKWLSKNKEK